MSSFIVICSISVESTRNPINQSIMTTVIWADNYIYMANNTFYDNGGYDIGIQIWANSTIESCVFNQSKADATVMFYRGTHLITNCTFSQTSVIVSSLVDCIVQDTTFEGGGYISLRVERFGTLYLNRVLFFNFTLTVALKAEGEINAVDTTFQYCDTGAIASNGGTLLCVGCYFLSNTNSYDTGVVFLGTESSATFVSSTFESSRDVPVIEALGSIMVDSCSFINDTILILNPRGENDIFATSSLSTSTLTPSTLTLTQPSFVFTSSSFENDNYTFLVTNVTVAIYNPLLLPFHHDNSSTETIVPSLSWCNNSVIITNTLSLPADPSCKVQFGAQPLINGSSILIQTSNSDNTTTTFYYSWQNDNGTRAIDLTLSLPNNSNDSSISSSFTVFASLVSSSSSSTPEVLPSSIPLPTIQNATWVSRLLKNESSCSLQLSDIGKSLEMDGLYIIGVSIIQPQQQQQSNKTSGGLNQATLSLVSTPSSLDEGAFQATVVPRIAFAGESVVVHVLLLNNWGLEATSPTPMTLQYGNTSVLIVESGYHPCNTLSNLDWKAWKSEYVYLNGKVIGRGTG